MTRNRDDDRSANESFEFDFDDGPRHDPLSETVELARGARTGPPPARRGPTRRLALLIAGAVACGVSAFLIVSAVRDNGESSPAAAPEPQTLQAATSAAVTTEGTTPTTTTAPATTAAAPVVETLVPVKPEDEGEDVRALQEALAAAGFSAGEADGVYGDATVAAVAAFQRSAGLVEDGIAGAETIAALEAALEGG
ncbi:MAG: peptidoglycan-binding protein [Thermoleophilia bacterium]|nr:peptidoglycan-binding protein [Thermoleophilia bacterium]